MYMKARMTLSPYRFTIKVIIIVYKEGHDGRKCSMNDVE